MKIKMNKEEKKLLLELIGNEQIHMIIKDHTKYDSEKYKMLESLKIKIKDVATYTVVTDVHFDESEKLNE